MSQGILAQRGAAKYETTTALEDAQVKFLPSEGLQEVRESCTDSGNADRFVNRWLDDVKYIHGLGWHTWDGKRWKLDDSDDASSMVDRARMVADSITNEARERVDVSRAQAARLLEWSVTSKSQTRLEAMLSVARSDRRISAKADSLDADPNVINCANGYVDLRTGEIATRHKGDPVAKLIPHNYNPKAECPTWLAHLDAVFQGDKELIAYFQRCVGYSLTALTVEQCGFFPCGSGANGKSTTLDAVRYSLGDYATVSDPVILLSGNVGASAKADALKADLVGVRFTTVSENDAGTRLNQADFKRMMTGNPITAKKLYQNPVTFNPVAKVWFDVNHLPTFDGTDDAMVRRMQVIPFNAKFKRGEKGTDGRRLDKLMAEAEGILAWAVRGALEWFARGGTQGSIGTCAAVQRATDDYATDNDPLASFIRWNYDTSDPNATTPVAEFQGALESHLQSERLPLISNRELNKRLEEMGIVRKQQKIAGYVQKVYRGIGRRLDTDDDTAF